MSLENYDPDDIVTRLRLWASVTEGDHVIEELHKAADEIERLRAEVAVWKELAADLAMAGAMNELTVSDES